MQPQVCTALLLACLLRTTAFPTEPSTRNVRGQPQRTLYTVNTQSLVHGRMQLPVHELEMVSKPGSTQRICLDIHLEWNAAQVQARSCISTKDTWWTFKLLIGSASVSGPGLLTISVRDLPLKVSQYVLLTGHYTWIDLGYIAPKQDSYSKIPQSSQSSTLHTSKAGSQAKSEASLTAVLPLSEILPFGAAVQLSRHNQPATVTHNYAVSEPFLMELLDTAASNYQAQPFTPLTDSLSCILSLFPHAPTSPATAHDINTSTKHSSVQHAEACSSHSQAAHTAVPWLLCACLFCSTLALTIKGRRHVPAPITSSPQASSLDMEESFHIRSKQPLITPMKDTGCSPFVPVTQSAMPPPPVPYHIASCSSKIGSYRTPRGAKPTASRALSTHTNTSGCTKWQRDRNGRLASLAVQEPDSEFTSSRARKQPNS